MDLFKKIVGPPVPIYEQLNDTDKAIEKLSNGPLWQDYTEWQQELSQEWVNIDD